MKKRPAEGCGSISWLGVTPRTGGVLFAFFFFSFLLRLLLTPAEWVASYARRAAVGVKWRHAISFRHLKSGVLEELEKARQGAMNDRAIAIQKVRRRRGPHGRARP